MANLSQLMRGTLALLIGLAIALPPKPASAHPHVWVTVEADIVYQDQKAVTGFRQQWTFDEFYSSFAIQGLDKNNDGQYDREELQELAEINISSLKDFDYFTFPKLGDELLEREAPKDYWLEYRGAQLTLFLTVPLKKPLPAEKVKDLRFAVYDPTFYVDFSLAKENPIRLSGAPSGCAPVIAEPNPQTIQRGVTSLGEAFFNNLDATSALAEQYARSVSIVCPSG